jgi:general secretion pathway protein G
MMRKKSNKLKAGFTLIEIMVVVIIIGLMATMLAPRILSRPDEARVTRTKTDMASIASALQLYRLDSGFYPTTDQGLMALIVAPTNEPIPMGWKPEGYIEGTEPPKDPWGRIYMYRSPAESGSGFEIISYGADGIEGGTEYNADIISVH